MLPDLHLALRLPLQLLAWGFVILAPGLACAAWLRRRKESSAAELGALGLCFGLMAAPLLGYLWVISTGEPLALSVLVAAAAGVLALVEPAVLKGGRPSHLRPTPRWLWAALALLFVLIFLNNDARLMQYALEEWRRTAATDCFMQGTYQYIGIASQIWPDGAPPIANKWDGVIRGNITLSSAHVLIFGPVGLRILRALAVVMLALLGWLLGERWAGRRGAVLGLLLFGANPYVVMITDIDRNVLALGWSAALLYLFDTDAPPALLGVLAGFAAGLGLNMLPVVYLVPVVLLLWTRHAGDLGAAARAIGSCLIVAIPITALWTAWIGLAPAPLDYAPFEHHFLGLEIHSHRPLAWPLHDALVRGPKDPYPTFLLYPMQASQHLGLLIPAAALLGLWRVFRQHRTRALALLLWLLPTYAVVSLQAVLTGIDQHRILLSGMLPIFFCAVLGFAALWEGRRALLRLAGSYAGLTALVVGLSFASFPMDDRVFDPRWHFWTSRDMSYRPLDALTPAQLEGLRADADRRVARMQRRYRIALPWPNYLEVLPPQWDMGEPTHLEPFGDFRAGSLEGLDVMAPPQAQQAQQAQQGP